jgi:Zn-finger nucleic acid-binding protein
MEEGIARISAGVANGQWTIISASHACGIEKIDVIITCPGCSSRYDVTGRRAGTRARCRCGTVVRIPKLGDQAEMLRCPGCGAPSSADVVSCAYCKAVLAVVACPACFGRVFAGSKHCQHCGAEILAAAQGDPEGASHHKCPRCSAELIGHLLGETLLDECNGCGGVWIQAAAFDKLIKSRDEQATVLSGSGPYLELEAYSSRAGALETPRYLPCPECAQLMNRKNFANSSGVIVDVCKPHGVWFDRDELGRIIQFVMKGGLDESRRRELERLDQKMKEKRAELAAISSSPTYEDAGPSTIDWSDLVHLMRELFR